MRALLFLGLGLALLAAACGSSIPSMPGPVPAYPGQDDPDFGIAGARGYYLVGDALTPGQDQLKLNVSPPSHISVIDAWIDGGEGMRATPHGDGTFDLTADISSLAPGSHEMLLAADGKPTAFARYTFIRTHALYVVVSTDWDDSHNPDGVDMLQEMLHQKHPELLITHFFAPYVFTDPATTDAQKTGYSDWVKMMRDTYHDEIGVHIHPYCNFISTTGVTCNTMPSTVYPAGDTTGYTVEVSSYNEQDFKTILESAKTLFAMHGLGTPTAFRAGGWTAEMDTLQSLVDAGFIVDSSAANWQYLTDWETVPGAILYQWNMQHWSSITDTSQPYYPSQSDILMSGAPHVPILEVPDNGILVDYAPTDLMKHIFDENWPQGTALMTPANFSIGYHPTDFSPDFYQRITDTLDYTDLFLASDGNGPVVYARLSDLVKVWPKPAN
jgi:hypothetical protein